MSRPLRWWMVRLGVVLSLGVVATLLGFDPVGVGSVIGLWLGTRQLRGNGLLHERLGTDLQPYEVQHRDAVLDYISSLEAELAEEKRLAGCGSEREAALQGKHDRLQERLAKIGATEVDRWNEGACQRNHP